MPSETTIKIVAKRTDILQRPRNIMIVAGETSGDMHAANLIRAMLRIDPSLHCYGMGGRQMQEAGAELIVDASQMAVVGLTDVIAHLHVILQAMKRLQSEMKKTKPDLLILIDYPGFNLRLAKAAKSLGIKIFYYISPKVWAWGKGRIEKIRKYVDKMGVIFPFEETLYRESGVNASFVGHPLLDDVKRKYTRQEALLKFGIQDNVKTVALLPGSRQAEVNMLLPEMLKAAELLSSALPAVQFILPLADAIPEEHVLNILKNYKIKIPIVRRDTYDVIAISDLAIVASGTATLETALLETPMIIVYRVSPLTYHIGKMFIQIKDIGLPNILAGKMIVPELLQKDATADKIAREATNILTSEKRTLKMISELTAIRNMLGEPGAAGRAAQLAMDMVNL